MGEVDGVVTADLSDAFTTRDLAEHWGVPQQTVRVAAARGDIPGCALVLGQYVFDKEVAIAGWKPAAIREAEGTAGPSHVGGRFVKGNTLGGRSEGGRPKRKTEESYLVALSENVSMDDWKAIVLRAVDDAKKGDWRARKWLSDYLLGTPVHRVLAEVGVTHRREFEAGQRAAAIEALLKSVAGGRIIDGIAAPVSGSAGSTDADGEGSAGRSLVQQLVMDAPSGEPTPDSSLHD